MSIDHSAREVLESATTRRRIVTTGAKAAYAAPVIAATMTLGGGHAGAVSGPQTTRHCSPPRLAVTRALAWSMRDDEWAVAERRYFSAESMKQLTAPTLPATTQEIFAAIA